MPKNISLSPPPVYFIKSISEQGYSLSTAIADLLDNSVAAGATKVEILLDTHRTPLRLFIADNGRGMNGDELTVNMRLPSADLDNIRGGDDLGRFGLGMKTGSFSQSRKFTVISRKEETGYEGRTWDVEYLRSTGEWTLVIEQEEEITTILDAYKATSQNFHESDDAFSVRTLIVWDQLYKLERLVKKNEMGDELEDLRSHLGLVFHRFLRSGELKIRLNNALIDGFDPFPDTANGVQVISENFWQSGDNYIRFEGIILPKRAAVESREPGSVWVPTGRTLDEMQGIFIYRNDRLIRFGAWLKAIPKSFYLQFGRIRIDITNASDAEFQLNVAKSSLTLPFGLRRAMTEMVRKVAVQAAGEYRERIASALIRPPATAAGLSLITKVTGAAGPILKINPEFELVRRLAQNIGPENAAMLTALLGMVENKLNEVWKGETANTEIAQPLTQEEEDKIVKIKNYYEESDYSAEEIRLLLSDSFGLSPAIKSFIENLTIK